MQLTVDIPDEQIARIDRESAKRQSSRDAILQQAVDAFFQSIPEVETPIDRPATSDAAFGLWADRGIDSVRYVQTIRDEWEA